MPEGGSNKSEMGGFSVEPRVVEEIAGVAAAQVEGVSALAGGLPGRLPLKGARGTVAAIDDDCIKIDVHIVVEYGPPLKDVAKKVQASVQEAVEAMVGRTVESVDVFVDAVKFPSGSG